MGTSSRYNGPVDRRNPLLPEGFDLDDYKNDTNKEENNNSIKLEHGNLKVPRLWKDSKTRMTNYLNGQTDKKQALKSYIKSLGGAKEAAKTATSGKISVVNLGKFLSNISSSGIRNTLQNSRIEFKNRNIEDILGDIINLLSPIPDSKENAISRNAMISTIEELYQDIEENVDNLDMLDNFSDSEFNDIFGNYINNYIYEKLLSDLGSRIEISNIEVDKIIELETDLKIYIKESVSSVLKKSNVITNNFFDKKIIGIIEKLYMDSYEVLEGVL